MNKKAIFIIITLLFLIAGVIAGVFLLRTRVGRQSKAAPSTSLQAVKPSGTIAVGDEFEVFINIATGENYVAGVELLITYDSTLVSLEEILPSTFFASVDTVGPAINNNAGTVSFAILQPPGYEPVQGSGQLATLRFVAESAGTAKIGFDSSGTIAVATREDSKNVLVGATSTNITIKGDEDDNNGIGGGGNATATPTPTPTATPAPTNTPYPTGSATPSPTPITELPDTGLPWPTAIGLLAGIILLAAGSLVFVL